MKKFLYLMISTLLLTGAAGQPSEAQAATKPACNTVWIVGKRLPDTYTNCAGGSHLTLVWKCDNRKHLFVYGHKYAYKGTKIRKGYKKALNHCLGG